MIGDVTESDHAAVFGRGYFLALPNGPKFR